MTRKNPLDIWCENEAILGCRFTYFWLVVVPPLDEVPRLDDPRPSPVRVILRAGARAGENLPDVARIHTRPKKLKYFSSYR